MRAARRSRGSRPHVTEPSPYSGQTTTDTNGTVDADATPDGAYLYVQTGAAGIVDGFKIHENGSLTSVGSVTVPNAVGGEGIVALHSTARPCRISTGQPGSAQAWGAEPGAPDLPKDGTRLPRALR